MNDKAMISPQEIAKKYHISYQTVNSYTNLGLLIVRKRRGNGRLYKIGEVRQRLEKIAKLKNRGYTLRLIRNLL
ncbi:MAG: MerR family transcriptional regulator [Candidatus Omnitrophica bacterium]|nr:MerR family transcriptional regulator [Candidatus Omnitrophota bacterium]